MDSVDAKGPASSAESPADRYGRFAKYWNETHQSEEKMSAACDKAVGFLSGGALGISFTFMKEIVGDKTPVCLCLLALGWFSLVVSLLAMLLSFRASVVAHHNLVKNATVENFDCGRDLTEGCERRTENWNLAAIWTCIIGIALVYSFAVLNLWTK